MKRLLSLPIWTHCTDETEKLKAPAVGLGRGKALTYKKAKDNADKRLSGSPYMGLIFGDKSEYIGLDVDVDPTGKQLNATRKIPSEVLFFLIAHPTHVHYSPSGNGIHIIYRLSKETQDELDKLNLTQKSASIKKGDLFDGDWRYRKSFLVFTENKHEQCIDEIAYITLDELLNIIPSIKPIKDAVIPDKIESRPSITQVPTLRNLQDILKVVPATFNETAQRACRNLPYAQPNSGYDYWVLIGCACAHHAIQLELCGRTEDSISVIDVFHDWSAQDTEGYINRDDVEQKFLLLLSSTRSKLKNHEQTTTMGTLSLIARGCIIAFPDIIRSAKGKERPDPASIKNLQALMLHEQLELVFDPMGGGVCFKGPEETVTKWFCPQRTYLAMRPKKYSQVASISDMAIRFRPFMQEKYNQSVSSQYARDAIDFLCQSMKQENAFKSWILSRPWDKVRRFEKVCVSIQIPKEYEDNASMYYSYIRRSLLSMVGIHFWPEDSPKIPAMLVLTGPEYTYKSSWAEWLIPKHMGNYTATAEVSTVLHDSKDWHMFLSTKAVVVINECEPMFTPRYEQKVKSNVDAETVTYRDPYAKHVLTRPRTALIIGTTNKNNLFTGSTGTRKIWQIPVSECDSMLIKNMNLQQLYAEIYYNLKAFKRDSPKTLIQSAWAQSADDRNKTNLMNAARKGIDIGVLGLLIERFGHFLERVFDPEEYIGARGMVLRVGKPGSTDNNPNAWTVSAMMKFLKLEFPDDRFDRPGVKYALDEYASAFTKTTHNTKYPFQPYVSNQKYNRPVTRGTVAISPTLQYYLMPELLQINSDDIVSDNVIDLKQKL